MCFDQLHLSNSTLKTNLRCRFLKIFCPCCEIGTLYWILTYIMTMLTELSLDYKQGVVRCKQADETRRPGQALVSRAKRRRYLLDRWRVRFESQTRCITAAAGTTFSHIYFRRGTISTSGISQSKLWGTMSKFPS